MASKKITLRHPDAANRDDAGLFIAESEREAVEAEAAGYRREDPKPDAVQVPVDPGAKAEQQKK